MIKKLTLTLLIAAVTTCTSMADNGWGIFGSYFSPDDGGDAAGIGGQLSIEMTETVLFDLRGTWYDDVGSGNIELELIPLEGGLTILFPASDSTDTYAGLGIGYYTVEGEVATPGSPKISFSPDDEIGFYGVVGVEATINSDMASYNATRSTFFAEVLYRVVEIDEVRIGSVDVATKDFSLDGVSVNAGLMIRW